jgi:UDP-glucose 4-epimerase
MLSSENILIVGGAGYIGSYVNKYLHKLGYNTVILDNLSTGKKERVPQGVFIQGDMNDQLLLSEIFENYNISSVMLFAAYISVGESVKDPMKYYFNNVYNPLRLFECMVKHNVLNLIFSSSAAIFGLPYKENIKINESHPCAPINPYGETKWMVEKILRDFDHSYNLKSSCLRYFNAAGGDPEGELTLFDLASSNLIPTAIQKHMKGQSINIFGTDYNTPDGTCIRDYVHIADLASAHLLALEQLLENKVSTQYNLGNGQGFSVREVLKSIERVSGQSVRINETERRAGDPPSLTADASKARRDLGWKTRFPTIDEIVTHAWATMEVKASKLV